MYPPLQLTNNLIISDIPDRNPLKKYLQAMEEGDDTLLVEMSTCPTFATARYDGPYKKFSDIIYGRWKNLYKWATGYKPDRDVFNKGNRACVLDSLISMVLCSRWSRYKKVYRFSPELELSFAAVDEVRVHVNMLDRLPFRSFYVEFAKDGLFDDNFHGCFVDVVKTKDSFVLKLMRLTHDLKTMCGMGTFKTGKEGEDVLFTVDRNDVDGHHEDDPNGLRNDWEEFCFFILNGLLYLCAANANIKESSRTKGTYTPGKKTKGGYSEMQMFDCGYVDGPDVSLVNGTGNKCGSREAGTSTGRTVRPHPVRASWQHYWKGHGENKERVLIFKDPYYVGGSPEYATVSRVPG